MDDAVVSRAYRAGATELPPSAIDARIRAAAEAAVDGKGARAVRIKRWAVPLSIAATVALSVTVVMQMSKRGVVEQETPVSQFAGAPPAAETASNVGEHTSTAERRLVEPKASKLAPSAPQAGLERQRTDTAETLKKPRSSSEEPARAAAAAKPESPVRADVVAVRISGSPGAYRFSVTVHSADTGCAQYADWWEVVGADGRLVYRRVLLHSHADEQPFERSGGPVPIQPDTTVWVRAHMSTTGYTGAALKGSVSGGFTPMTPAAEFAQALATQPPLPDGCAF
jgi:hypothetical protein